MLQPIDWAFHRDWTLKQWTALLNLYHNSLGNFRSPVLCSTAHHIVISTPILLWRTQRWLECHCAEDDAFFLSSYCVSISLSCTFIFFSPSPHCNILKSQILRGKYSFSVLDSIYCAFALENRPSCVDNNAEMQGLLLTWGHNEAGE